MSSTGDAAAAAGSPAMPETRAPDMQPGDFPGLYGDANEASARAQRTYMASLRLEYLLLILASLFGLNLSGARVYYIAYALIFLLLIGVVAYRATQRPEQIWYKSRALAESIKTSTWRFMMRAPPFDGAERVEPRQAFHDYLRDILRTNQQIGRSLMGGSAAGYHVTPYMERVRAAPLHERRAIYRDRRIRDQRNWYIRRAQQNRRDFRLWVGLLIFVYSLGTVAALTRVAFPEARWLALDPLIAIAVGVHIVWAGVGLMRRSVLGLLDAAIPGDEVKEIDKILAEYSKRYGVSFHALRTRHAGARRFVSFHLLVPDEWTVSHAHKLSEEIESRIRSLVPNAALEVHIEPISDPASYDDQTLDR